jgi:excinuclease ABC subunit C
MPIQDLKARIARLPEQPGVYLYFNEGGETIYVGKARALRDRVRSYLGAYGRDAKTDALLDEAHHLEVIVTDSVVEALALENHLIKARSPRFNILLRDDKNYPYLQLTTGEAFPRVLVARRVERDEHFYAGPFLPATFARRTMALTHRLFGIRSCNEVITGQRGRPCLEYDIQRCIAPCVATICSPDEYQRAVADTRMFLEGRRDELVVQLRDRMLAASAEERFEEAAQLRDAMRTVQTLQARQQKMASSSLGDRDAFGLKIGPAGAVIQVFQMRGGRVIERIELETDASGRGASADAAVLQAAVEQFYADRGVPPEVHLPAEPEDAEVLEAWLSSRAGHRVSVVVPKRGDKRGLIELAARNAAIAYQARFSDGAIAHHEALETLRDVLALPAVPRRIECFDISTIQGSETVASMVVCEDGRMRRAEYRKFRVRGDRGEGLAAGLGARASGFDSVGPRLANGGASPAAERRLDYGAEPNERVATLHGHAAFADGARRLGSDDFAAMQEVVLRRYRKTLERGGPFPDLIVIDGGKGQLSAAYAALQELGLANLVAIGLAKKEELVFTRDREDPIALPTNDPALLLLQRIRDEAHRFAVTFHRRARTMRDLRSELDAIPGVGARRRKTLLTRFGSVAGVRRATREELVTAVGAKVADAVLAYFATK